MCESKCFKNNCQMFCYTNANFIWSVSAMELSPNEGPCGYVIHGGLVMLEISNWVISRKWPCFMSNEFWLTK